MLVPSIGTGPVHGPMLLDAADSTVGGMLSLNVNVARLDWTLDVFVVSNK